MGAYERLERNKMGREASTDTLGDEPIVDLELFEANKAKTGNDKVFVDQSLLITP